MLWSLFVIAGLIVLLTLLPLSRSEKWWVRSMDFPRLQLLTLASSVGILSAVFANALPALWFVGAVMLLVALFHAWWIWPYTPLHAVEVRRSESADNAQCRVRLLTANVLKGNRNAQMFIRLVRQHQPDIIVTLETDMWWQTKLAELEQDYPHTVQCPLDNLYGMHVYSRLPLSDSSIEYLVEADVPSIHTWVNLPDGSGFRAHFMHPAPPSPTENESSIERDVELLMLAKTISQDTTVPCLVAGDLNDVAWSATTRLFRKTSGLLDPRIGRGVFNTFHAAYSWLRWPLDHIFLSGHFRLVKLSRLSAFGSDHFPLLSELTVHTSAKTAQVNGSSAEQIDDNLAAKKLDSKEASANDVPTPGP